MSNGQSISSPMISSCNCRGPQNGDPLCPCEMRNVTQKDGRSVKKEQDLGPVFEKSDWNFDKKKQSHFEDLPYQRKSCTDPSHDVPNMIVVPQGKVYIHVCPTCGHEGRIYPNPISF